MQKSPAGWFPNPEGGGERFWDGEQWTDQYRGRPESSDQPEDELVEVSRAGTALAAVGTTVLFISVFLPHLESDTFMQIVDNSMIQNGLGWGPIIVAILAAVALFRTWNQRKLTKSLLVAGALAIAYAVYAGTGERLELQGVGPGSGRFGFSDTASPGLGVYAAGIGGLLMALGGALLAGWNFQGAGASSPKASGDAGTKTCPDCAESILGDARVCKHCGYRFQS